jgi:hypothetical protein
VSPKGYPQRPPCCKNPGDRKIKEKRKRKRKEKEKEAYSVRTLVMAKANAVDLASPLKYDHGGKEKGDKGRI